MKITFRSATVRLVLLLVSKQCLSDPPEGYVVISEMRRHGDKQDAISHRRIL